MQTTSCTWPYVVPIGEDPAAHGHWCAFTDLYHTIPYQWLRLALALFCLPLIWLAPYQLFSSCCYLPAVSPGGLRWCFFFFGRDGWLISLRFVFGAWGGSLGASVRANVRVRLACSGRFYLECTVGGPVVYMGRRQKWGDKERTVQRFRELFG